MLLTSRRDLFSAVAYSSLKRIAVLGIVGLTWGVWFYQ